MTALMPDGNDPAAAAAAANSNATAANVRLLIALASEAVLIELEHGNQVDEVRDAVRAMLRGA